MQAEPPAGPRGEASTSRPATILRSISEGVKTIVTVSERLHDLRSEGVALRQDLQRLAEAVYRIAGRLDGIDQRFVNVDKQVELEVKLAVRDELERQQKPLKLDDTKS